MLAPMWREEKGATAREVGTDEWRERLPGGCPPVLLLGG
jgi:hypothetical protein